MTTSIETFVDLSAYAPQLDILHSDPNTRIVGSIGRMAAAQKAIGDPYIEMRDHERAGLAVDRLPSIDVLGTSAEVIEAAQAAGPAVVNTRVFGDTDVSVELLGNRWFLQSAQADFSEEVPRRLMDPVTETIKDTEVEVLTVSLVAHRLLHGLHQGDAAREYQTEQTIGHLINQVSLRYGIWLRASIDQSRPFSHLSLTQTRLKV